jgi:FHA domain
VFDANAAASGGIISGIPGFSAPAAPDQRTTADAGRAAMAGSAHAPSLLEEVPASSVPAAAEPGAHADDDLGSTRVRSSTGPAPAPVPQPAGISIRFDDGREVSVEGTALIGRNPAAGPGEHADQLIDFADMGRSVSKTHLQLRVDGGTVWVADRNSTNGTAVTGTGGARTQLTPGSPVPATIGDTVHFGDRSFVIGQA